MKTLREYIDLVDGKIHEGIFDRFKKDRTLPHDPRLEPALAQAKSENKWIDPFTWHQAWFYARVLTDMNAEQAMAEYNRNHQGNMSATNPDPKTWKIAFDTQRQEGLDEEATPEAIARIEQLSSK